MAVVHHGTRNDRTCSCCGSGIVYDESLIIVEEAILITPKEIVPGIFRGIKDWIKYSKIAQEILCETCAAGVIETNPGLYQGGFCAECGYIIREGDDHYILGNHTVCLNCVETLAGRKETGFSGTGEWEWDRSKGDWK